MAEAGTAEPGLVDRTINWIATTYNDIVGTAGEAAASLVDGARWGVELVVGWLYKPGDEQFEPEGALGGLITDTLGRVDLLVGNFIGVAWEGLAESELKPIATTLAILSVCVFGMLVLAGRVNMTIGEVATRFFRIVLVYYFFFFGAPLLQKVYAIATQTPIAIGQVFVEAGRGVTQEDRDASRAVYPTLVTGLDQLNVHIWGWFAKVRYTTKELDDRTMGTAVTGVLGITLFALTYSVYLLIVSKVAVGLLLALGPFVVLLLLFDKTRHMWEGWVKTVVSFSLVPILLYAIWGLVFTMVYGQLVGMNVWFGVIDVNDVGDGIINVEAVENQLGSKEIAKMAPFSLTILATVLLVTQVPGWAAAIAGGATLGDGLGLLYKKDRTTQEFGGGGQARDTRPPPGMRG